jgi:HTH-type transcriptional repressor of NAD biosynthesis genes
MRRYRTGLVVGKFAPLHLGHEHVIRAADDACDHVVLLSYSRPELPGCDPARRAAWLAIRFPQATRIVLDHATGPLPENSDPDETHQAFCAQVLRQRYRRPIDAVFTSESYGAGFAADLAFRQSAPVDHIAVDFSRGTIPISGTALRADIHGLRRFLSSEVYATFVQRVGILGGESTGKSSLTAGLAAALGTVHVSEYGRELWEARDGRLTFDDMFAIAREQVRREEAVLLQPDVHRFLFCDTTPLTTLFYSLELFQRVAVELEGLANRPYHHLVLCADDFPFIQDGTRRDASFRTKGQAWYRQALRTRSHVLAKGSLPTRIVTVRSAISDAGAEGAASDVAGANAS